MFARFARTRLFSLAVPIGGLITGLAPVFYSGVNTSFEAASFSLPVENPAPFDEYNLASISFSTLEPSDGVTPPYVAPAEAISLLVPEPVPLPLPDTSTEIALPVSVSAGPVAPKPEESVRVASLESAPPLASVLPTIHAAPLYTVVVEKAKPPKGWNSFCKHYPRECDVTADKPQDIHLTPELWDTLVAVNASVNKHVKPMTDMRHWGKNNKWNYAEDGYGDCKDYVLVKQRKLIEAGLPRQSLLVTIVWTKQNQGHAVLIVRTDKGDYVLDNLSRRVLLWTKTSHDYVKRQSQTNPNDWVYIDGNSQKKAVTLASKGR